MFSDIEMDVLKEVASIGSGNAATALSQMLNKKVDLSLPTTKLIPIEEFPMQFKDPNMVVVGTYMEVFGEVSGEIILFFPRDDANVLSKMLLGDKFGKSMDLDESMFKEVANIVCSAYINSLSNMLNIEILPSVPHYACDILSALIDFTLVKLSSKADSALYVSGSFNVEGKNIAGNIYVIFEEESLRKITSILLKNG